MQNSFRELSKKLKDGSTTCRKEVERYLINIEKTRELNAYISVFDEESLQRADEVDSRILSGNAGKLAGMVVSVKDVISVKGYKMTCASKMLSNFTALFNATIIDFLSREDAIIIGKTNCDEFAMGSSNENSHFGNVLNPYDKSRVPGGSSGGSAVSVAADTCRISLGSETGGSIRQPAAFCNIYGLKATYGRISRYGLTAFASSFDSIGVFANNTSDIYDVMEVISGKDENDSTSSEAPFISENNDPKNITFGYAAEYFGEGLNNEIKEGIFNKIESLKKAGYKVKEISLPHSKYTIQAYYILTSAEASSNLARYDGVRYGYRSKEHSSLEEMYLNTRTEGFGEEVKRRIMLGTYVLSSGYYDAYYKKGQKVRRKIMEDFDNAFTEIDFIISPTTPDTAFKIGEKNDDPLSMYLNDIYTASINLAGVPAISIPAGFDSKKLPYGMQLIGKKFSEAGLLKAADLIANL